MMLEQVGDELVQVRASGLGKLINVVSLQFRQYISLFQHIYEETGKTPALEEIEKDYSEFTSFNIVAQTFTAMIVEAFYFDYYHGKESKGRAEEWSKQSPIKQFEQLSENFLHATDYKDTDLYVKLNDLNKVRKRWVHNQTAQLGKYKKDLNYLSADGCVQLLREFFSYFHSHDDTCYTALATYNALTQLQIDYKGFCGNNESS
ncbi:MAG: hypothetical protein GYB41_09690 [Oceanospirillales bacterium]|nr:hypothetical protein [Oceanospirillales bacterium]